MEDYKKKYEQALERAKNIRFGNPNSGTANVVCEQIFPELKESEDEKIRKEVISFLKEGNPYHCPNSVRRQEWITWIEKQGKIKRSDYPYVPGWRENRPDNKPKIKHSILMLTTHGVAEGEWLGEEWCQYRWSCKVKDEDVLYWLHLSDLETLEKENANQDFSWLEKQGEQKPADKVEPKFKVGDCVVHKETGMIHQIQQCVELANAHTYGYDLTDGGYINIFKTYEYRLWTIQDAKDGDVLANDTSIIIFRKLGNDAWNDVVDYYVGYNHNSGKIVIQSGKSHYVKINTVTFKPATKEQRDLIFQKMKETGYEWDAEKKELKKIEQKPISIVDDWIEDYWKHYKVNNPDSYDKGEEIQFDHDGFVRFCQTHCPNPAWSEEDEMMLNSIIQDYEAASRSFCGHQGKLNWLKSLKERMKGE